MKQLSKFFFLVIAVLGPIDFLWAGQDAIKGSAIKDSISTYVGIQEGLAQDNLKEAQQQAEGMKALLKSTSVSLDFDKALEAFLGAKDIEAARKEFKKISTPYVKWVTDEKAKDFEVVYCPMAGAKWVQKKGKIQNPYFGVEMLSCGEKAS